ncbi:thermonuclease family protein [Entomomonas asaccharolytica]|uniref:Thermonuclease family protein n=1 Tax=Entomomonas asaccharolytica TaxID=2785331 RepID=A0A974NGV6_9GAMM|nr:thermonuclease family protein [Entomomonas asaccharolytica]QQP86350.1 thermonuclease family protein [Entomomonas asaccharolytica]
MKRKLPLFKRLQHNPIICIVILLIAVGFYYYQISENSFTAEVIHVIDGDTIDVLVVNQSIRIRLAGIDAPETGQAFGAKAKKVLADMIKNKVVTVIQVDKDQYQRMVAIIKLDELNINQEMVRLGMAWVYTNYNQDYNLPLLEAKAKANKTGLWSQSNPIPPWVYRKQLVKLK